MLPGIIQTRNTRINSCNARTHPTYEILFHRRPRAQGHDTCYLVSYKPHNTRTCSCTHTRIRQAPSQKATGAQHAPKAVAPYIQSFNAKVAPFALLPQCMLWNIKHKGGGRRFFVHRIDVTLLSRSVAVTYAKKTLTTGATAIPQHASRCPAHGISRLHTPTQCGGPRASTPGQRCS